MIILGITHACVWAAACSYITQNTEPELRSSAQGVIQGIYQGLGRGSGSILGGVVINRFGMTCIPMALTWIFYNNFCFLGSRIAFFLYGLVCALVLGLFVHVNYYRKQEGYKFEDEIPSEDMIINDSSALAPHGVPTNPIARSVSRQNVTPTAANSERRMSSTLAVNENNNTYQSTDHWDPNTAWN